jgi:DNA-binding beta-propeller fold protein YncE
LNQPFGVAVDGAGNVYIADLSNNRVLKVPPSDPTRSTPGDCTTVGSGLSGPGAVAVDASDNVYIADNGNHRVLKVPANDPTCLSSCAAVATGLNDTEGVAVDSNGNVYIGERGANLMVKLAPAANFGTVAVGSQSAASTFNFIFDTAGQLGSIAVLTQGATGLDFQDAGGGRAIPQPFMPSELPAR